MKRLFACLLAFSFFIPLFSLLPSAAAEEEGTVTVLMRTDEVPDGADVFASYGDVHLAEVPESVAVAAEADPDVLVAENTAFSVADGDAVPAGTDGQALDNLADVLSEPVARGRIALVDTGVPEGGVSVLGTDGTDTHGHGTKMRELIRSVDPDADVLSIQALDGNGNGDAASLYAGIRYAIEADVSVIVLAVSGRATEGNAVLEDILAEADGAGILVVAAAGNYGSDASGFLPGGSDHVFTVGAAENNGKKLATSNFGDAVDLYVTAGSTSEAAAYFAGAVSLAGFDLEAAMQSPISDRFYTDAETGESFGWYPDTDGFSAQWAGTGKESQVNSAALMMPYIGLRVYDAYVPITVTSNGFAWRYRSEPASKEGHTDGSGNPISWTHELYSVRSGGRSQSGDWVNVRYSGAGSYNGKPIDVNVRLDFGNSSGLPYNGNAIQTNETCISFRENHTDWTNRNTANIMSGMIYFNSTGVSAHYSFYESGTNNLIPVNTCYFSWGSLNYQEGVTAYDYQGIEYYVQPGALPIVARTTVASDSQWGSVGVEWLVNLTGNDFVDDHRNGADFWKSVGTMKVVDNDHTFDFRMKTAAFWFAPSFAPVGATAPPPQKWIRTGARGTDLTTGRVSSATVHTGDTVTFEVRQQVEVYGYTGTGYLKYSNFSFSDTLPGEVSYQGARMLRFKDGVWTDVTNQGTLTRSGQTVNFAFSGSYLSNGMLYYGETYVLEITAKVNSGATANRSFTNAASTRICNTPQNTNAVTLNQYFYPVKTQIRYRDVNGNWTAYADKHTATVEHNGSYSYTWTRSASEPSNVYYDADPKSVSATGITEAKTFYMSVERKKYTYDFQFHAPTGHTDLEITNKQASLENKWAETMSGTAKNPALTGYTFLGWNTKADGTGSAWTNEKMLSNKTFHARWKANQYKVHYDGNGASNPDHLMGEFTQNTVTTASGMPDSTYTYDTKGTLRTNDFVREGYEFIGWNTKADGTGTSYPDKYDNVLNWSSTDGAEITLYAQWRKKLGTETLIVVSEETGNPVSGVSLNLYKKVNGSWTLVPGIGTKTTGTDGKVTVSGLHWFDYEWRSVSVPDGYQGMEDVNYTITYNHLSQQDTRILYMKHVRLVLDSVVSDIIPGEEPPAFLYHVEGTDAAGVDHAYDVLVRTGADGTGSKAAPDMFAGTWNVTQTPVSRYVPGNAENVKASTVSGINGTANLMTDTEAEIRFPYTMRQYGYFGSMDSETNALRKGGGAMHSPAAGNRPGGSGNGTNGSGNGAGNGTGDGTGTNGTGNGTNISGNGAVSVPADRTENSSVSYGTGSGRPGSHTAISREPGSVNGSGDMGRIPAGTDGSDGDRTDGSDAAAGSDGGQAARNGSGQADGATGTGTGDLDNSGSTDGKQKDRVPGITDTEAMDGAETGGPDFSAFTGLDEPVAVGSEATVTYMVSDAKGLTRVETYVDGELIQTVTAFGDDDHRHAGSFTLQAKDREQAVRLVAENTAGQVTDTADDGFMPVDGSTFRSGITVRERAQGRDKAAWPVFYVFAGVFLFGAAFAMRKKIRNKY